MKVKELIKKLRKLPQDAEVLHGQELGVGHAYEVVNIVIGWHVLDGNDYSPGDIGEPEDDEDYYSDDDERPVKAIFLLGE
jgi:hypothetical protein